eukprot:12428359-Karenia_brevis.AAC.1
MKFGNMFNTTAMMHRHRVGARVNATSLQLPWEALLQELRKLDEVQDQQSMPPLPRTGSDLHHIVQVLSKNKR